MSGPRVATAIQARTLLRPELFALLTALMNGPGSVGELAAQVQAPPRQVYHHLQTLLAVGVAEVVGERPRAGRAVKLYRADSPWFIPFEVTGAVHLTEFLGAQLLPRLEKMVALSAAQLLSESPDWGYWLQADHIGLGTPRGPLGSMGELGTPLMLAIGGLRLRPEQAFELRARLEALLRDYRDTGEEAPGTQRYSLALLMARGNWQEQG